MIQKKILKLAKMLNRFTVEDLAVIFEKSENELVAEIDTLVDQGQVKKITGDEYLFTDTQKPSFRLPAKKSSGKNDLYYYFRDFYLLYAAEMHNAYKVSKEKYLRENPQVPEKILPNIKNLTRRLHTEFRQSIIDTYRYRGQVLKKDFHRKYIEENPLQKSKRTVKEVPESFNFSINELLNAARIALTCHFEELLNKKAVKFEKFGRNYTFRLNSDHDFSGLKYGDLVFDILLCCFHLLETKSKNEEDSILISVDDIAFLRLGESFKRGFKVKDKEFYRKYVEFLGNITLSVDAGKEMPLINLKSRTFYYFKLQIPACLLENTEGQLETYLLKYPIFTRRREKRMGYFLKYLAQSGQTRLKILLKDVFDEIGTTTNLNKHAALERIYLEELLDELTKKGLISSWAYEGVTNEIMNRQRWLKDFVNCFLRIELANPMKH
jgi:hypothetical protein